MPVYLVTASKPWTLLSQTLIDIVPLGEAAAHSPVPWLHVTGQRTAILFRHSSELDHLLSIILRQLHDTRSLRDSRTATTLRSEDIAATDLTVPVN